MWDWLESVSYSGNSKVGIFMKFATRRKLYLRIWFPIQLLCLAACYSSSAMLPTKRISKWMCDFDQGYFELCDFGLLLRPHFWPASARFRSAREVAPPTRNYFSSSAYLIEHGTRNGELRWQEATIVSIWYNTTEYICSGLPLSTLGLFGLVVLIREVWARSSCRHITLLGRSFPANIKLNNSPNRGVSRFPALVFWKIFIAYKIWRRVQ